MLRQQKPSFYIVKIWINNGHFKTILSRKAKRPGILRAFCFLVLKVKQASHFYCHRIPTMDPEHPRRLSRLTLDNQGKLPHDLILIQAG
jgi:hypothetical protein